MLRNKAESLLNENGGSSNHKQKNYAKRTEQRWNSKKRATLLHLWPLLWPTIHVFCM